LQAMIEACEAGTIPARIVLVISNVPDAYGLTRAKQQGIPTKVIDHQAFSDRNTYELEIVKELKKHEVGLVCLAGYMRIVGPILLEHYAGKLINIHPSLLPAFPGLHGQRQALLHGVKLAGATVHFVDDGCDTGPIIMQECVPVLDNDTEESLSERILTIEHKIYPLAIKLFAEGKLKIEGRRVIRL